MRSRREWIAYLLLAGCGTGTGEGTTVPDRCYAEATSIEIDGIAEGDLRHLHYGPQGGQHVYPGIVVTGVDPRALTVRVELVRELDGVTVADQLFTRFEPGLGECDVALPHTELFVQSRFADGTTVLARVTADDGAMRGTLEARGVCVSSTDACGPYDALVVRAGMDAIADGDVVAAPGELSLTVEGTGIVWGRVGTRTIEQRASTPIAIAVTPGDAIPIALGLSPELPPAHGVLGTFEGTITIAP